MNDTTKTCTKCGNAYPATSEHFSRNKESKDGLQLWCKSCQRMYYQINRDKKQEQRRKYYQANREKIQKQNLEYFYINREKRQEKRQEYRQTNQDKIRERKRAYNQINREKRQRYARKYYQTNKDKVREYDRANWDKQRIKKARRRARKRQLPATFTHEQWLKCLEYFDYSCAVCGISFNDIQPHADHWIPLSSDECTGTVATNMVCLCASCNSSKKDKIPRLWLIERYGTDAANETLKQIEIYFNLVA